jgi:hypothetical protein
VVEIIARQNFKIENMRYMLLKQDTVCKQMQTQMTNMQQDHDRTVTQLNQQITVMMEALSMLMSSNEADQQVYTNNN